MYILGDPFLRNYYVVFDKSNKQLGIATKTKLQNAIPEPELPGPNYSMYFIYIGVPAGITVCCFIYIIYSIFSKNKHSHTHAEPMLDPENGKPASQFSNPSHTGIQLEPETKVQQI